MRNVSSTASVVGLVLICLVRHVVSAFNTCTPVSSWTNLKQIIASNVKKNLVLCPFQIIKPDRWKPILFDEDRVSRIFCQVPRRCKITGKGNLVKISGKNGRVYFNGFIFEGATKNAVVIASTSKLLHTFKKCTFRQNTGPSRGRSGGAISTGPGTNLQLIDTKFVNNRATAGAAIAHAGTQLKITGCYFFKNYATGNEKGVVQLAPESSADIASSKFNLNRGGIRAVNVGDVIIRANVSGKFDKFCTGLFIASKGVCFLFQQIPFDLGKLDRKELGIWLSQGLTIDIVAHTGEPVQFKSPKAATSLSSIPFHSMPDAAAIFPLDNSGSYTYVSNAEVGAPAYRGGVYGLNFDAKGRTKGYRTLMTGTTRNCNGGVTPWGTWVSCEEYNNGQCWQVHPKGERQAQMTVLGEELGGFFEAFAADTRDTRNPKFFISEDVENGAVRRYRPPPNTPYTWDMLHQPQGVVDYLEFRPGNTFGWTNSIEAGRNSAFNNYKFVEGIAHTAGKLLFVAKTQKELLILDLDRKTYTKESTITGHLPRGGSFGDGPDQISVRSNGMIYFTEDGGPTPGIFVYNTITKFWHTFLEVFENYPNDETTGIDWSPDGKVMYFCLQEHGYLFQVRRLDGQAFEGRRVLKWKYDLGR